MTTDLDHPVPYTLTPMAHAALTGAIDGVPADPGPVISPPETARRLAMPGGICARADSGPDADYDAGLYVAAADLSATAADIAADIAEGRACPGNLTRARRLLATLAGALGEDGDRPPVVCLCGSTRFYDQFQQANYDLTMRGEIVLSVGFYPHAKAAHGHGEGVGHDSAEKTALDELHKRKIDLADYVLVLNVGGYIGESTRSEIAYATAHGKPVRYLQSPGSAA